MGNQSDEKLTQNELKKAQLGDHKAFRRIYDIYFPFVKFIVDRCGVHGPAGDDVIQESFIRLYQNLNSIRDVRAIKSWLATTARHLIIDSKRREKRVAVSMTADISLLLDQIDKIDESAENVHRELEIMLLSELIDSIGREAGGESFVMFYRDGMSAAQIAERNQEAISTVTTRISRLRKKFRDKLREHIEQLRQ